MLVAAHVVMLVATQVNNLSATVPSPSEVQPWKQLLSEKNGPAI